MDVSKLYHPAWSGVVVPLMLAIGSTFTPATVRGVLLVAAVVSVAWTFHVTEFGGRQWKRTGVVVGLCVAAAIGVFFVGQVVDAASKPKPSVATIDTKTAIASEAALPVSKQHVGNGSESVAKNNAPQPKSHAIQSDATAEKPVKVGASQPPGSIIQGNSGGVNIQQGTTGNNSPIINSPITIGDVPQKLSASDYESVRSRLSTCPSKPLVYVVADQVSGKDEIPKQFYDLLKNSGWIMEEVGVNKYGAIYGPGHDFAGAIITVKGDPLKQGEQSSFEESDPAACIGRALGAIREFSVPVTLTLNAGRAEGTIKIDFTGGFVRRN
jgi:hypothetical protein